MQKMFDFIIAEKNEINIKESISAPTQSSSSTITPKPTFRSSTSITYVSNTEENNLAIKAKKVNSPLIEHSESEQKILSTNIKDNELIKTTTNTISTFDSEITKNQQNDNQQQQQYDYKENNEFFNPFILNMKLWQNYYNSCEFLFRIIKALTEQLEIFEDKVI
jgi:hypothetical protein